GSHILRIGEVVEIHADRSCLKDGKPDISKINPIVYAQSTYFGVGKPIAKAFSEGMKYRKT
ncbi:MAG: flavin reductase family protein, partial [Methanomicrobiales archaeon]|nr:flavin reductase family protein [Methanomicrobiales archaeon]